MIPSIGRIVHYQSYGSADGTYKPACRAAIITNVCEDPDHANPDPDTSTVCVALTVFNPEGLFIHQHLPQDETKQRGGTWHWPERLPEGDAHV
jgi:hypothetical protein